MSCGPGAWRKACRLTSWSILMFTTLRECANTSSALPARSREYGGRCIVRGGKFEIVGRGLAASAGGAVMEFPNALA